MENAAAYGSHPRRLEDFPSRQKVECILRLPDRGVGVSCAGNSSGGQLGFCGGHFVDYERQRSGTFADGGP